jgi:hypothetical protein
VAPRLLARIMPHVMATIQAKKAAHSTYEASRPFQANGPETAVSLFISCASCSIGAATLEAAGARSADDHDTVILLSASKYPAMSKVARHLPGRESPETHASALAAIIASYEARLRPTGR